MSTPRSIKVLVTEAEYRWIENAADGRPLSTWIKKRILPQTVKAQLEDLFGKEKLAEAMKDVAQPGEKEQDVPDRTTKNSARDRTAHLGERRARPARGTRRGRAGAGAFCPDRLYWRSVAPGFSRSRFSGLTLPRRLCVGEGQGVMQHHAETR